MVQLRTNNHCELISHEPPEQLTAMWVMTVGDESLNSNGLQHRAAGEDSRTLSRPPVSMVAWCVAARLMQYYTMNMSSCIFYYVPTRLTWLIWMTYGSIDA